MLRDLERGAPEPPLAVGVFFGDREGWHFRGPLEILKSPVCHPANNCIPVVAMVTLSISRLRGMVLPSVDSGTLGSWAEAAGSPPYLVGWVMVALLTGAAKDAPGR